MDTPDERESQARNLTTTSYAVLSILSLRPHSTYDIARQMRRSMHYLWPRAESNVYAEPRRLVEAGLAASREEWIGRRRRTVYAITDRGRAALARWLASPSARQRYECEALIKVLFAENASTRELRASIQALADDAADIVDHFLRVADQYEAQEGEYPSRFGLTGLAIRLLMEQQAATLRWAQWAEEVVDGWAFPTAEDASWGIRTLRATGEPFPLTDDPVRAHVSGPSRAAAREAGDPDG